MKIYLEGWIEEIFPPCPHLLSDRNRQEFSFHPLLGDSCANFSYDFDTISKKILDTRPNTTANMFKEIIFHPDFCLTP